MDSSIIKLGIAKLIKKPLIIALVLLAIFLTVRNCRLSPNINRLEGRIALQGEVIKEGDSVLREAGRVLREAEKGHDKAITILNGKINSSNTVIARLMEEDKSKEKRIEELEEELPKLSTAEEKIEYWETWGTVWKERFTLCTQVGSEKDKIIFSLSQKYEVESQLNIQLVSLSRIQKTQISLLETQLQTTASLTAKLGRQLRLSKSVRTGTALVLAGVVVYVLVKK